MVHILLGLLLLLAAIQDIFTRTVYREPILGATLLFFLLNTLGLGPVNPLGSLLGLVVLGLGLELLRILGTLITRHADAFGRGDVLLGTAVSTALGPFEGGAVLFWAFLLSGFYGLFLLLRGKGAQATMPWAPFLFLAFLLRFLL